MENDQNGRDRLHRQPCRAPTPSFVNRLANSSELALRRIPHKWAMAAQRGGSRRRWCPMWRGDLRRRWWTAAELNGTGRGATRVRRKEIGLPLELNVAHFSVHDAKKKICQSPCAHPCELASGYESTGLPGFLLKKATHMHYPHNRGQKIHSGTILYPQLRIWVANYIHRY
jgi:hypothetical protein